jgi:hypothetical protein
MANADEALLSLMDATNAVLARIAIVSERLQRGRADVALSKLQGSGGTGASIQYVPREIVASRRVRGFATGALSLVDSSAAGASTGGRGPAPAGSSLRQRRGGGGERGAGTGLTADVPDSPLSWFGANPSARVLSAQAAFTDVLLLLLELTSTRAALGAAMAGAR